MRPASTAKLWLLDAAGVPFQSSVDIRAAGGMVYAPPTRVVHPLDQSVRVYKFCDGSPSLHDAPPVPESLAQAIFDAQRRGGGTSGGQHGSASAPRRSTASNDVLKRKDVRRRDATDSSIQEYAPKR